MGFLNQDRGLTIAGTDYSYLSEGAYGVIFADRTAGRVIKLFKRRSEEKHVRSVFRAEIDAYDVAASSEEVSSLIPGNFQLFAVDQVTDKQGKDVTGEFFSDLAFQTDFVKGHFHKIAVIDRAEASRVRRLFREVGIYHTSDMSVTVGAEGRILKAIDFATKEHELMHGE